jgi:hypothetical protein
MRPDEGLFPVYQVGGRSTPNQFGAHFQLFLRRFEAIFRVAAHKIAGH